MIAESSPSSPGASHVPPLKPRAASHTGLKVGAIILVVVVVVAGLYLYYYKKPASTPAATLEEGGFTQGQAVTFVYNGTDTFRCTPGLLTFFPNATQAASSTPCEVGAANQNAVLQYPEWVLVPAFAGLSIFGMTSLGATARGFPQFQSSPLLTDCGAGGTPTACVDHPKLIYSPLYTQVEKFLNITTGVGGYPEGVLPTPSHDHLLNTSATFPNVQWGTIVVLVFDPNIWPDRASGTCTERVSTGLSNATANCLVSITALDNALRTHTSAVAIANKGNAIWQTLGGPSTQVVIPGDLTIAQINNLDANLYIPFAVQPGAPSSGYPT